MKPKQPLTSLSFDKIIATVNCPWRHCRSGRGVDCIDSRGGFQNVPHKSRFKAAVKKLEAADAQEVKG